MQMTQAQTHWTQILMTMESVMDQMQSHQFAALDLIQLQMEMTAHRPWWL